MCIEERELLVAVHDVHRVVDIKGHALGRSGVAGAVEIDHDTRQPDQLAQR